MAKHGLKFVHLLFAAVKYYKLKKYIFEIENIQATEQRLICLFTTFLSRKPQHWFIFLHVKVKQSEMIPTKFTTGQSSSVRKARFVTSIYSNTFTRFEDDYLTLFVILIHYNVLFKV